MRAFPALFLPDRQVINGNDSALTVLLHHTVNEGLRAAFVNAIIQGLNKTGWVDLGPGFESGDPSRILVKGLRPVSTLRNNTSVTDDDHRATPHRTLVTVKCTPCRDQ